MEYYQPLRYLNDNRLILPQVRANALASLPTVEDACATPDLFEAEHRITDLRFVHNDEPAQPATEFAIYTDGDRLLLLARAAEPDPERMQTLVPAGEGTIAFEGTAMDYDVYKDDHVGFFLDGQCSHEFVSFFLLSPLNARLHGRVRCPMNNHPIPAREQQDFDPQYETCARIGADHWVAALAIGLAEVDAQGVPVVGLNVVRHRRREVRETAAWVPPVWIDPRTFGHLLLEEHAVAPTVIDFGRPVFGTNRVTVEFPRGRGRVSLSCSYEPVSHKPASGPLPQGTESGPVELELSEDGNTTAVAELTVHHSTPDGRIVFEARSGDALCYRGVYPNGCHALIYVHKNSSHFEEPVAAPSPADPSFVDRKRDYICSRLPCFERTPRYVLRAKNGAVEIDLLQEGAVDRIAEFCRSLFEEETDRLLAALMLANSPVFTNHAAPFTSMEYELTPLSALRLGAGDCYSRATVLAGIISRMADDSGDYHEAYPMLVLGHVITSVKTGWGWVPLDPSFGHFYYTRDNTRLATAEELSRDLELVDRVDPQRRCEFLYPETHARFHFGRIVYPPGANPW